MEPYRQNDVFKLAYNFINQTSCPVFLTGKAGTGKTTFLKFLKENTFKNTLIAAPTGVAAINAGGVTLHSLFQLPTGVFIPSSNQRLDQFVYNEYTLLKNIRLSQTKRELIKAAELLVIDEVSMLRCDVLDAINTVAKYVRKNQMPFGGLQVLFIGDLFQLPPVVTNNEWQLLCDYYNTPFFFDAYCLKQQPPIIIELDTIYRQSDVDFINALNKIRNNEVSDDVLKFINSHYFPNYENKIREGFITLTTHNAVADKINTNALEELSGKLFEFDAEIKGDFPINGYPVSGNLQLKKEAQVMFIKNDKGNDRKYFNGKIAWVKSVADNHLVLRDEENNDIVVNKETWRNIQYNYNVEKDAIEEEELGSFIQFPIRLAWAVTIHKSQGLTFEKAVIDCSRAFACGQVYVALSRLTSVKGLVLQSPLNPSSISTDQRVVEFMRQKKPMHDLNSIFISEKEKYLNQLIMLAFDFNDMVHILERHAAGYDKRSIPKKEEAEEWAMQLLHHAHELNDVAMKFKPHLNKMIVNNEKELLKSKIDAAINHFSPLFDSNLIEPVKHQVNQYKNRTKSKKYVNDIIQLGAHIENLKIKMHHVKKMMESEQALLVANPFHKYQFSKEITGDKLSLPKKGRPEKGSSSKLSLQLFREGKLVEEIAEERSLSVSTIQSHLASYVLTGEVNILELTNEAILQKVSKAIDHLPEGFTISQVFQYLNKTVNHAIITAVVNHRSFLQTV